MPNHPWSSKRARENAYFWCCENYSTSSHSTALDCLHQSEGAGCHPIKGCHPMRHAPPARPSRCHLAVCNASIGSAIYTFCYMFKFYISPNFLFSSYPMQLFYLFLLISPINHHFISFRLGNDFCFLRNLCRVSKRTHFSRFYNAVTFTCEATWRPYAVM